MKKLWNNLSWGEQMSFTAWCGGIALILSSYIKSTDIEKVTLILIGATICASSITYNIGVSHGKRSKQN